MKRTFLRCVALLSCCLATTLATAGPLDAGDSTCPVVPRPLTYQTTGGEPFCLTAKTIIAADEALLPQAEWLSQALAAPTGWDLAVRTGSKGQICLRIDTVAVPKPEGYRLTVHKKGVRVDAHDAAGAFYALQTLLQSLPAAVHGERRCAPGLWQIPALESEDAPEHPWRGLMLDAARYYYDKSFIMKCIDMMALYKLNKFQFHFIDDCGWRLESKKYPRLTEVGAWAGSNEKRIGGFYTQDDIREIVAYAAVRGVEVIPEIEFPAHILSAVVAYPWLSCTGMQHEVPEQHFISRDLLCPGNPQAMQFLHDILDETMELFPSKYINIGGDEAVYTRWEQCPKCRALMEREGFTQASQLQGWITNQVALWMQAKGRTVMGWEEIVMRGRVATPVVAVMWHEPKDTTEVVSEGHQAVIASCYYNYFDFPESGTPGEPQHAGWCPPISLEKAYATPLPDYAPTSSILGVQACMWSDQFIHGKALQEIAYLDENRSEQYVEYFLYPRLMAVAEVGWTASHLRSYDDFLHRLSAQYARLDAKSCNYRVPEPAVVRLEENGGQFTYTLAPTVEGAELRYTTDGSYPTIHSPRYTGPVTVARKSDFMAIQVVTPTHYSLPLLTPPDYSAYAAYGQMTAQWQPLTVQPMLSPWRFECTGKVSGNGHYTVTFIPRRGANSLQLETLTVRKRDEIIATASPERQADGTTAYTFSVETFEAGTPFYIEVQACGQGGNDTSGLVFLRKD